MPRALASAALLVATLAACGGRSGDATAAGAASGPSTETRSPVGIVPTAESTAGSGVAGPGAGATAVGGVAGGQDSGGAAAAGSAPAPTAGDAAASAP